MCLRLHRIRGRLLRAALYDFRELQRARISCRWQLAHRMQLHVSQLVVRTDVLRMPRRCGWRERQLRRLPAGLRRRSAVVHSRVRSGGLQLPRDECFRRDDHWLRVHVPQPLEWDDM